MFGISSASATILTIPATYATAFGFVYAYGKLMLAMASSKLFPRLLRKRSRTGAPYVAILSGSVLGYLVCLLVYFVPFIGLQLFNICLLCAFVAYSAQCVGYIQLNTKFKNLPREFRSPLGIPGAVYSLMVWALGVVSIIGFQDDNQFAFIVVVCMIVLLTVFYYAYAKSRQTFSEEERKIMFVAHVVNCKYSILSHPIIIISHHTINIFYHNNVQNNI